VKNAPRDRGVLIEREAAHNVAVLDFTRCSSEARKPRRLPRFPACRRATHLRCPGLWVWSRRVRHSLYSPHRLLLSTEPNATKAATARDLLKSCGSSLDGADYSYCLGVMDGAEDVAIVASGTNFSRIPENCRSMFASATPSQTSHSWLRPLSHGLALIRPPAIGTKPSA
jgi:hypothetical protein